MSMEQDVVGAALPAGGRTRIAPATFRGVDCAVLAERYAAYRRERCQDLPVNIPDVIEPPVAVAENH